LALVVAGMSPSTVKGRSRAASQDPERFRVLNDQWPHEAILDSLP
jgi:hypothetical protein